MSKPSFDKRFMGLAGSRRKPPGEFLTHTLKYLVKGWVYGLLSLLIVPFSFFREIVIEGIFFVPLWALIALISICIFSANFYYGYQTDQQDLDALHVYIPKAQPYLFELLHEVLNASFLLFVCLIIGQIVRYAPNPPHTIWDFLPNPCVIVLIAYPFGATHQLLGKFKAVNSPDVWLSIHAWTYCLIGVPTTANTTARDLRVQILDGQEEAFNGRHAYLSVAYTIYSVILFWSLLEFFSIGFALFVSPFISFWSLTSTLAVTILPIAEELVGIRVQSEVDEYNKLQQADKKAVLVLEEVKDPDKANPYDRFFP